MPKNIVFLLYSQDLITFMDKMVSNNKLINVKWNDDDIAETDTGGYLTYICCPCCVLMDNSIIIMTIYIAPLTIRVYKVLYISSLQSIPRVTLVGHDWGGGLVWSMAQYFPERVRWTHVHRFSDTPLPDPWCCSKMCFLLRVKGCSVSEHSSVPCRSFRSSCRETEGFSHIWLPVLLPRACKSVCSMLTC